MMTLDDSSYENKIIFCVCILIILGVLLRSFGYFFDPISLWTDEAMWLRKLYNSSIFDFAKRPIGYKIVNKLLFQFGISEPIIRLSSWLPSVFSLFLVSFICKKLFKLNSSFILTVMFVATNPYLICHAKEFKPYSLEFFCHLSIIYGCIKCWNTTNLKSCVTLWALFLILILFSYNLVFLLPTVFFVSYISFYNSKNKKGLLILCIFSFISITLFLASYILYLSNLNMEYKILYWGGKYDVFYLPIHDYFTINHYFWLISKYRDMLFASMAGKSSLVYFFDTAGIDILKNILILCLHLVGLLALIIRKKGKILIIFLLPIITVTIVHLNGFWLYGGFRVNLFILPYFLFITMYGFDVLLTKFEINKSAVTVGLLLFFLLIQLNLDFRFYFYKNYWARHTNIRDAIEYILKQENLNTNRESKILLAVDAVSYGPCKYYLYSLNNLNNKYKNIIEDIDLIRLKRKEEKFIDDLNKLKDRNIWLMLNKRSIINNQNIYRHIKNNLNVKYYYRYPQSTLIMNIIKQNTKTKRDY